jgi:hypothetical protein
MSRAIRLALAIAAFAILAATMSTNALAYFSGGGSGTGNAAITTLPAPNISAATPAAGGTVTLTWGAVTPPGAESVAYYVTRDGGKPAGNCPTSSAPTTVTTCIDSGVSIAEHSYRVVAVWETWTSTSAVKTAKVTIGEAVKFTIAGSTTTPATGGVVNLTITAKDVNNATVTTYANSHNIVFAGAQAGPLGTEPTVVNSAGTAINLGTATALTFTSGVATVVSSKNGVLKIYNPGAASITATEGSVTTPTPLALNVLPTASRFVIAAATVTPAVGASDDLTITAMDAYGNLSTNYTGSKSLVFSGPVASTGGNTPTVTNSSGTAINVGSATAINFTEGVAKAANGDGGKTVLYKAAAAALKATEGSVTTPTGLTITPTPGTASKLVLTTSTTTPVAGTGFNITTTAQDAYGNTATSYTGSKNITFSGAAASPSGTAATVVNAAGTVINFGSVTALTFTNGVAAPASSKNGFTKTAATGAASVTASDGTISTAAGLALTTSAGAATRVALSGIAVSAGSIGSPCLFTCTVTPLGNSGTVKAMATITDALGNVVSNVGSAKTVTVTTNGGAITGGTLTVPATGTAISSTEFTYTAPASEPFTNTITLASTGYTSATVAASK